MDKWNTKCRFFNEDYACDTLSSEGYKSCKECKFASEYDKKILIIKLGALGDVIRTTPILQSIKEKYPESLIYWLVNDLYGNSKAILKNNPNIDKILIFNIENVLRLQQEKFDILYSLETTTPGTLIANIVEANEKYGYYFDNGSTSCFNKEAEPYLETVFLTHIKKQNRKTYQELIFEASGFKFNKQEIIFELSEEDKKYAQNFKKHNSITKKILGINFGSGKRWPSKAWAEENLIKLIKKLKDKYQIILLGGPEEKEKLEELKNKLEKEKIKIITNNPDNTISQFASIINICDKVITTDSLALHLSIALKKKAIALFFSTPPWEIEDYNTVKKITSPLLNKYFFSNFYSKELSESISVEEVLKAINSI